MFSAKKNNTTCYKHCKQIKYIINSIIAIFVVLCSVNTIKIHFSSILQFHIII